MLNIPGHVVGERVKVLLVLVFFVELFSLLFSELQFLLESHFKSSLVDLLQDAL